MKFTSKIASLLVLMAGLAGLSFGQTALTQTTLSAAVSGPALYSGTSPTISSSVTLAACTGIAAPLLPGTPSSIIYVDREAMGVFTVNGCTLGVIRGYLGTQASPHVSGAMVLFGPNYAVTVALGGNPVPNGFFTQDPPFGGTCTAANTPTTPWVNVLTGAQWICSSITGTWVPGWQNPWAATSTWGQTATVASAAGAVTPSGPYFNISGTAAITGFNIPIGFNTSLGGCFTANPTGIWTWTAAGNIATAGTTTAATTPVTFCWNVVSAKWIPSRLS
ncbi:MAG: hypothetical protein JWO19_4421 [Bryobacterales bacterium]|nr:hypothetical protein [Bryobacterales bacterium]